MDALKNCVELFFSPLGIITLLLASGLALRSFERTSPGGSRLLFGGALLFLLSTLSPLPDLLLRTLEACYSPLLTLPASVPTRPIVILAGYGEQYPFTPVTSNLSDETICRLAEGMRLYRQVPGAKIIVSGGVLPHRSRSVGALMAECLREMGISYRDIVIEGRALNTYENLVEVKRLVGTRPFILVTAACDLRRAMAVARRLSMSPVAAPAWIKTLQLYPPGMGPGKWMTAILHGFLRPSPWRLIYMQRAYHEYLGYAWYMLLGRI